MTAGGAGNWLAVWYSCDSLGSGLGTNRDIVLARTQWDRQGVPAVSEWGLVVGTVMFRATRSPARSLEVFG